MHQGGPPFDLELSVPNPLRVQDLNVAERKDYLSVVAALAGADGHADVDELALVDRYLDLFDMAGDAAFRRRLRQIAAKPETLNLQRATERLQGSPLRFTLMTDLLRMAKVDEQYTEGERAVIVSLAEHLGIDTHQLNAMERWVDSLIAARASETPDTNDVRRKLDGNTAGSVAAAALPSAVVAGMGLSAGSVAGGLASLGGVVGSGAAVVGLSPLAAGMAITGAVGAAGFFAVRWAYDALAADERPITDA